MGRGTSRLEVRFHCWDFVDGKKERHMNGLIYLIGLIVVIMAILSFFGLR